MITAIIADDEIKSRQTLSAILSKYYPGVTIIGEAGNAEEAYDLLTRLQPQLLFLDISMPHEDGFELLKRFDHIPFEIIFITAYEQYAIKAIKTCALDYLLKPLDIDEVIAAIDKAKKNIAQKQGNTAIAQLLHNLNTPKTGHNKLAVPTKSGFDFITLEEIVRMEAESNYTVIFLTGGRKIVSTRNLKEYEDTLPADHFFRSHHSHIINLAHIATYHKGEGGYVKMNDGSTVDISKRKKKEFLALFAM
jgi:two-component system LytT family response regulator